MLWRFLIGAVVVIAFTAATTAVAGLLQFKQFTDYLSLTPALKGADVTIANPGNPQTLLLIGSDHRAGTPFRLANTDTMMLVRLDPDSSTINVLSIPRDLKVDIPGHGTQKVNATYSIGGPNLLLRVLRTQVFPGLHVNHIIDVNFRGFSDMVDAIGCVYTDVDHRYYNNTAYTNYSSIDIQPGYQKLCGANQSEKGALAFVRFRHTDTDIVRNARQQDFLRWAKSQFGESQLISERNKLVKIFGQNAQTDHNLHTEDGLINLFNLVAFSAAHTVKQIRFPANLLPCGGGVVNAQGIAVGGTPCYVGANRAAEQRVFSEFMAPTLGSSGGGGVSTTTHHVSVARSAAAANLTADVADGKSQAGALGAAGLPVYFPRLIASGSNYCSSLTGNCNNAQEPAFEYAHSYPRAYVLRDTNGHPHAAYRMTLVLNSLLGEYYGVQGTTWQNPPILNKPNETRTVAGKQLMLFFNGHKLTLVGWRTGSAAYWISNTLTDDLSNQQMLGIAASLTRAG